MHNKLKETRTVVNATTDTVVQRTMYYASGAPMAQSWGRDTQPYLYNGKEFIEAHGWNTYDYGFRGYYASIGRFTSIDPLAEQTPWQSPYAYAGNNFINNIDWMGLMQVLNWCAVDGNGNVKGWGRNGDYFVYEVDDDWDGTYEGLDGYGINIDDPEHVVWRKKENHRAGNAEHEKAWDNFFESHQNYSKEEVLKARDEIENNIWQNNREIPAN